MNRNLLNLLTLELKKETKMNRKYRRKNIFKIGLLYGAIAIVLTGWLVGRCVSRNIVFTIRKGSHAKDENF